MALQCGIVGLPNVGKSTIFNALTKSSGADAANYPFCTIDPNVGVVEVPDARFRFLVETVQPISSVPAAMEFVDIAGLVKGASNNEGLGNKFLSHIRNVDAILHVVRCFEDENVIHVDGSLDPVRDVEIIELELILADLEIVENRMHSNQKKKKSGDKEAIKLQDVLEKIFDVLKEGKMAAAAGLDEKEKLLVKDLALITLKPFLYIGNIEENMVTEPEQSTTFHTLTEYAKKHGQTAIPLSGKIESEISLLDNDEEKEFLESLGLSEPGLHRVIRSSYELLGYITFFTAGEKEVKAWTITRGTKAPEAAGTIHSDIETGFIRAEVVSFEDVKNLGSVKKAQEKGKMRLEGKEYEMHDGDVVYFRFNV